MADSIYKWSLTAASNDAVDSAVNWRENQLPDTVNDSARNMMMRIAELREDLTGGLVTAGTQPAYTVVTKAAFDSLADGRWFTCRVHATNAAGAATLNVNALGAKAIRKFGTSGDMPLGVGDLQLGGLYQFMYSASGNAGAGAWVVPNPSIATGGGFAAGTQMLFMNATAPVGWTKLTAHDNKALRVVSGTGGASGGTVAFTTAFASYTPTGSNTAVGLSVAMLPSHTHTQQGGFTSTTVSADHSHYSSWASAGRNAGHIHTVPIYGGGTASSNVRAEGTAYAGAPGTSGENVDHAHGVAGSSGGISANHTHAVYLSGETVATGSGATHNHTWTGVARDFSVQYVDSIICSKD